jgi:hypothetical protein
MSYIKPLRAKIKSSGEIFSAHFQYQILSKSVQYFQGSKTRTDIFVITDMTSVNTCQRFDWTWSVLENLKGRDHSEDLGVNERIGKVGWEGVDWIHLMQVLGLSRRWRLKSRPSGLWRRILLWWQHGPLKRWYPTTTHGVTTRTWLGYIWLRTETSGGLKLVTSGRLLWRR